MNRIIFVQALIWYFWDMPKGILIAWKNYLYFNLKYFSIPTLLRTFFTHWHRYYYPYGDKWNPMRYVEAFVFNGFSRIIGVILRTAFIIIGLVFEIAILIIGLVVFLGWFTLIPLILFLLIIGIGLLI